MVEVSTSILSADKENSLGVFYNLEVAKTNYFHIDVMDGKFVENNTIELMQEYVGQIKQISNIPLDIHLMVKDIKTFVDSYIAYEPNTITFHLEACENEKQAKEIIRYIHDNHIKVGMAIKPNTSTQELYKYLPYLNSVLIMTVEPGKGGQKLIPSTIEKVEKIKEYIENNNIDIDIEVDGGVNLENVERLKEAGANIIVAGTAIVNSKDYTKTIEKIKK